MTKNTKKIKYDFIIDLTDVNSCAEAYDALVNAKIEANVNISPVEHVNACIYYTDIIHHLINDATAQLAEVLLTNTCCTPKKPSLWKRIKNWFTRKK